MTKNLGKFIILSAALGLVVSACNKDDDDSQEPIVSSSTVVVSSFSLTKDTKVLPGLDSVYFSIDLDRAEVFNADSLPFGTNVSRLIPLIGTAGCSVAELYFTTADGKDTIVDYLRHSTDSVNFANGPVKLHLVAQDGITARDYQLKVNVHQMKSDSLYWNRTARRSLPLLDMVPARQKTVMIRGRYLCLAASGPATNQVYNMGWVSNLQQWDATAVKPQTGANFPPDLDVTTMVAGDDVLYILDQNGELYISDSVDPASGLPGTAWRRAGIRYEHLYGTFGNEALGCLIDNGSYYFMSYPGGIRTAVDDTDFPVSGTSEMIDIDTKWAANPQKLMIGGRKADGSLTGAVWGYDGASWARISRAEVPAAEGRTMFMYTTFSTDSTNWSVTEYPTLFTVGGRDALGVNDATMYISRDMGLTWKEGDDLIQLPTYIPAMADAQAFVATATFNVNSRSDGGWESLRDNPLPVWYAIIPMHFGRAIRPITQWEAPMVYLFGGVNEDGTLYNTVWQGVINRLTFKPLQ